MSRKVVLLVLLVQAQLAFSQETYNDLLAGKKSFAIGLNDALVHNFNFTYTKYTPKQYAYEFLIGYRSNDVLGSPFTSLVVKDQPWLYNQCTLRFGIKFYSYERLYIAPMVIANYGYYNDILFEGYKDRDALVSRTKTATGGILKFGFTPIQKRVLFDIYLGFGYRLSYITEKLNDPYSSTEVENSAFWNNEVTIHIGFQLGIVFK